MALLQQAIAALRGPGANAGAAQAPGAQPRPLDLGTGQVTPTSMDTPNPGTQQQNLPGGNTALPPQQTGVPLQGAQLANLARQVMGQRGPTPGGPLPVRMAPMGGGGRPPVLQNPLQQPQQTAAPQAQGPNSIGAFLASPEGQQLLARLRALQQGGMMAA